MGVKNAWLESRLHTNKVFTFSGRGSIWCRIIFGITGIKLRECSNRMLGNCFIIMSVPLAPLDHHFLHDFAYWNLHRPLFLAFYLMYARLEEDHGLARHAMAIYDRATKAVLPEEQFEVGGAIIFLDMYIEFISTVK